VAREFGWKSRAAAALAGPLLLATLRLEERRLRRGVTYEPSTFYELNESAAALHDPGWRDAKAGRSVSAERAGEQRPETPAFEPDPVSSKEGRRELPEERRLSA
jgi:hypothetical protein